MKNALTLIVLSLAILFQAGVTYGQAHSELWGVGGEKWSPTSRLPDFSYAGYHFGEDPLPKVKAVTDVTQFGAKGDGQTDCTDAFIKAIEATDQGAIIIPPGRYLVSDIIWITKPNIVLRGAGPDKTVIYITKNLEAVRPNIGATTSGRTTSNYSWSGGFIWAKGDNARKTIANITSQSKRGSNQITISKPADLKTGQLVLVELHDDDEKSLINYFYSKDPGNIDKIIKPSRTEMVSRIAVIDGKTITLERPLRFDIRQSWSPVLKAFEPTVTEVGIEDLAIEFPVKPYQGHFTELGMNAIAMNNVANCWVRNVRISNSDSGIYLKSYF